MKILHILRSEPDDLVEQLVENLSGEDGATVTSLYQDDVDWWRLVDDIFSHQKIICWW